MILTRTKKIDETLAVIDGKRPNAVNHPLRAELTKAESGFEPAAFGFLDLAALPPLPPQTVKLGLDGLKRIDLRWGFQDDALMGVIRVVAPSPRRGVLALLDQPAFGISSLPPLPSTLSGFTVLSADLVKTYDQIVGMAKLASPEGAAQVRNFETVARQRLGLDLRGDLLRYVGPKLALYAQPTTQKAGENPALVLLSQFAGTTISVQVRDPVGAEKSVDSLIETINSALKEQPKAAGANANTPFLQFEKQAGPHSRHEIDLIAGGVRGPLAEMYRPTVMVGEDQLVVSLTPGAAERAQAAGRTDQSWRPSGAFLTMTRRLSTNLIFLNVSDPRESLPALIESLPTALQGINVAITNAMPPGRQGGRRNPLAGRSEQGSQRD